MDNPAPADHAQQVLDEPVDEPTTAVVAPQRRQATTDRRQAVDRRAGLDRRSGLDRRRGPGRRRGEVRRQSEDGEMGGELWEFVHAIDEYKRINDKPFPSWSEIFEIIHYLGYRKVAPVAQHINTAAGADQAESDRDVIQTDEAND